jgi:hypothetical protein
MSPINMSILKPVQRPPSDHELLLTGGRYDMKAENETLKWGSLLAGSR